MNMGQLFKGQSPKGRSLRGSGGAARARRSSQSVANQLSAPSRVFQELKIDRESILPAYLQIASHARDKMLAGALKIGDRLPPNRRLAQSLGVNRTTVTTAYAELEADGLITSQVGRGTFVAALPAAHTRPSSVRAESGASLGAASAGPSPASPSLMNWGAILLPVQRDRWLSGLLHSASARDV